MKIRTKRNTLKHRTHYYYRGIFHKYDTDHDGFITVEELHHALSEYENDIPEYMVKKIHELQDQKLDFDEFIHMVNNPILSHVFGHYVTRYINWVVPKRKDPSKTSTSALQRCSGFEEYGKYDNEYSCMPPPVGMILISVIEIMMYATQYVLEQSDKKGPYFCFIYDPQRRIEIWRYVTYMFVHSHLLHLGSNLLLQIMLGIPLEMVHRWWRVLIVYLAGVLSGSLISSMVDPNTSLNGASGGVYALITAHVATIIMNWNDMYFPLGQLLIFLTVAASDIGNTLYNRIFQEDSTSHAAHLGGAIAGLLVGINILRNLSESRMEKIIWHISLVIYVLLMGTCIMWNLAVPSYFPKQL